MADHSHPIDRTGVAAARRAALTSEEGEQTAELLRLLADPVRARIVSALGVVGELCVGDLALALEVSDSSVSHALRLLRTAGVVANRRDGRVVYYRLAAPGATAVLDAAAVPGSGRAGVV